MNNFILDNKKNYVFYLISVIIIIYLIFALFLGLTENSISSNQSSRYDTAMDMMNKGRFEEARPILRELNNKYNNSYILQWSYAICLDNLGDYKQAVAFFKKAKNQRPFIVMDQYFLTQMGKSLYDNQNYSEALKYYNTSKELNTYPELTDTAENMIQDIKIKLKQK